MLSFDPYVTLAWQEYQNYVRFEILGDTLGYLALGFPPDVNGSLMISTPPALGRPLRLASLLTLHSGHDLGACSLHATHSGGSKPCGHRSLVQQLLYH